MQDGLVGASNACFAQMDAPPENLARPFVGSVTPGGAGAIVAFLVLYGIAIVAGAAFLFIMRGRFGYQTLGK